jgi:hypothetical protein
MRREFTDKITKLSIIQRQQELAFQSQVGIDDYIGDSIATLWPALERAGHKVVIESPI